MSDISKTWAKYIPAGSTVLGVLLALYYGTVVLAGLHFTVLQLMTVWGLVLIFMPAYRASLTRSEVGLILSVTAIFAAAVLSYVVNGLWDHPDANLSRYARFLFFVPIYLVVRRFATARMFWTGLVIGSFATGLWGVFEYSGLVRHPDDHWGEVSGAVNPIQFGDLTLAMAAMTAAGLRVYRQYGPGWVVFAVCAIALAIFACLACNTRSAWITMPGLGLLLVWAYFRAGILDAKKIMVLALLLTASMAAVIPQTEVMPQVERAVDEFRDYYPGSARVSDVGYRFELWRASWEIFRSNPLLGVGPGMFRTSAQSLLEQGAIYNREALEFTQPLSEYFFVLATLGMVGIFTLILLFLVPLIRFSRAMLWSEDESRWVGLSGMVLVVGYLHFGLTEGMFFQHATFLGFYLLSVAILSVLLQQRSTTSGTESIS